MSPLNHLGTSTTHAPWVGFGEDALIRAALIKASQCLMYQHPHD